MIFDVLHPFHPQYLNFHAIPEGTQDALILAADMTVQVRVQLKVVYSLVHVRLKWLYPESCGASPPES
jgi:hypothetical protein